jgi:hypothetical protein
VRAVPFQRRGPVAQRTEREPSKLRAVVRFHPGPPARRRLLSTARGRGGTGRRAGFRSRWASALGGSTPLARTGQLRVAPSRDVRDHGGKPTVTDGTHGRNPRREPTAGTHGARHPEVRFTRRTCPAGALRKLRDETHGETHGARHPEVRFTRRTCPAGTLRKLPDEAHGAKQPEVHGARHPEVRFTRRTCPVWAYY